MTLLLGVVHGWGDAHQAPSELTGITEASLQRAQSLLKEGQFERALAELSAGIRSEPSARLYYARALVLMDLDRNPEASRDLKTAFELANDWILNRSAVRLHEMLRPPVPWGYLANLSTSQTHRLTTEEATIGRSVPSAGIVNDVPIDDPSRFVSRRHAVIRNDHTLEDLRSTNGTTLNARYLPYGRVEPFADGDLIVLASTQVLRFATNERAQVPDLPAGIWGILIDGTSSRYFFLTESTYSMRTVDGGISLIAHDADDAIFSIRKQERGIEMLDPLDGWGARVAIRHSDRDYESFDLDSNSWFDAKSFPIELTQTADLGADSVAIVFQVVAVK